MARILTDLGEEWMNKFDISASTPDVGLYNDSTDGISDANDLADITTEPTSGNYSRQASISVSAADISGDWGIYNDNSISFDVTNTTEDVDSYFFVINFQATDTGDGSATDHLVLTGALSQTYDLSNVDTLTISSQTSGVTVD